MSALLDLEHALIAIRRTIIAAIASDDVLMERLILKGGNALDIVYQLGQRSSLDVDFSMTEDLADEIALAEFEQRLFRALADRFDSIGYVVIDMKLTERPRPPAGQRSGAGLTIWGGYNATFKLVRKTEEKVFLAELSRRTKKKHGREATAEEVQDARRRNAVTIGHGADRVFTIEISKFEYTAGCVVQRVDEFDCYVYTPAMIAVEKLRAICQQLPEYLERRHPTPRPKDFFDIYIIASLTGCKLDEPGYHELVRNVFAAKNVPLELLSRVGDDSVRAFHFQQWDSVRNAVRGSTLPFDDYFDFVSGIAMELYRHLGQSSTEGRSSAG